MMQVTQSPFLQALGFAIINSLWQFALLWLLYLFINGILKPSSHQKYSAALIIQFTGFGWFIGTLFFYYNKCINNAYVDYPIIPLLNNVHLSGGTLRDTIFNIVLKGEQLLPYLSIVYIIILLLLCLKTIRCYKIAARVRTNGIEKINVDWRLFVQKIAAQLGIKKPVKIYLSHLVQTPVTLGFIKPVVLLPIATLNNLSIAQTEAVLLHELAHIKRNDYFINLLLTVVETALFFNPFTRLISNQIKKERENSCDDWVLQYNYCAASYAKALLTIARSKNSVATPFAMSATNKRQSLLLARVKRIIGKTDRSFNYRAQLITLVIMSGMLGVVTIVTSLKHPKHVARQIFQQELIIEPLTSTVDNPLFNPVFFLATQKSEISTKNNDVNNKVAEVSLAEEKLKHQPLENDLDVQFVSAPPAPPPPPEPGVVFSPVYEVDTAVTYEVNSLVNKIYIFNADQIEAIKKAKLEGVLQQLKNIENVQEVYNEVNNILMELNKLESITITEKKILKTKTAKQNVVADKHISAKRGNPAQTSKKINSAELNELTVEKLLLKILDAKQKAEEELLKEHEKAIKKKLEEIIPFSYTYSQKPRISVALNGQSVTPNIPSETKQRKDVEVEKVEIEIPESLPCEKAEKTKKITPAKRVNIIRI